MKKNQIPQVSFINFLRHSLEIVKNPLPFHHKNFEEKGDLFSLKLGFVTNVLFCRDAALAEYVLQKNQKNYTKTEIQTKDLAKYVGKGLLTSEGDHWKKQRKLIQPSFHKKQLQALMHTMLEAIETEYERIEVDKRVDIYPILSDLAFQVVVKSLFTKAATDEEITRLQYITEAAQKMLVRELRQPYLGWWFSMSGTIKKHIDLIREAREILRGIIHERKASEQHFDDLLDMLLSAQYDDGSLIEEEQLIDEILILFTAGHETTSNALTFIFQLLALHPEWQERIFEESEQLKSTNDLMTQVAGAKICQQVIEEAMRLYPPAYFMDRVNYEDDTFQGKSFKKGTNFLLSIYEIHRHPKLWENPEDFRPERFADGGRKFSSHYFPFGAGPRKCIGNNFAMFEMIMAVHTLVSQIKIEPQFENIEITPLITLKPKNGFLKFVKRK
jgi:cytochrome P450